MEPADEELQQLTAPPARTSNNKARAVVACVALASTALLFAVTQKTPKGTSPAVLAAREVVKQQIQDRDTTPGAGPHGPGDADVTHDVDSCSDPCIPCTNAGSYSSFPTIIQHLMVYNKEATPYGGVIFTDRGQYGRDRCLVSRKFGVCGGFTPSTRVVSRNDGSGWFLFRF